jgi:hypothetical protein
MSSMWPDSIKVAAASRMLGYSGFELDSRSRSGLYALRIGNVIRFRGHAPGFESFSQSSDPGIGVRQHEDRFAATVTGESVGDQLGLAATSWRGHGPAIDRQQVNLVVRHCLPIQICARHNS